ncbi:MAG TPA: response regulator, partial [Comamonas sp.]
MSRPPSAFDGVFPDGALYRKFFYTFEDEMYLHDAQGVLLDVNAAACANMGYSREELIGMTVAQISAEYEDEQLQALWVGHPVGQNVVASNCHRRKDGSTYHLDVYITCHEVEGQKFFLAAARRTEEKRQRENEIVELNQRLRALVDERTRKWQASSRLLNAVAEQTPDAIFIKDTQGRYQYVNRSLSAQLGLSVEEILGRTDYDLYPQDQAQAFVATDQEVLQSNTTHVYEARMHNGKQTVFANTMKTPYRDEEDRVVGILGITRNVTDTRHAQEQMAHNYEMLRQAERIAKIGSWTLDLNTNTFTASEMLSAMNGLSPEDPPLTPQTLASMIPPEQHAVLSAAIAQCIEHGTPYTVDVEHKSPGGGTFPARIRGQAYRDANGHIVLLHGTLQDLSDHVEADQRLQTLADNLPNGAIFRCEQTQEGKLLLRYVSAGIQRLLGIGANAFLTQQKTFTNQVFDEDKASFFAQVEHSMQTGQAFDLVSRIRNDQGDLRWMRARAVPRRTQQGMLWEGILLDVTPEYEIQESLRQAKEAAEAAERAKSEFLATMSHEIRTPMNTVIGMTQLLQQTPMSPKQRNYLDKVALSANALLKIINDILDFSKLEAEMLHTDPVPFQLDELLESVSTVTGLRAEQKGIEIVYNIAPNVPRQLLGDVQRLSQVLTNLVGNAIKFTDRGEVVISMHAEPLHSDTSSGTWTLHVSVRDTGIGIEPDHMDSLFQPFTQAEAHITRRFGGTGLGLAICRKLVQLMGGDIHVHSELGKGSEFQFHVQLQAQHANSTSKTLNLHHCRVLVVDDNLMAREMLTNMVQGFGLDCSAASSGPEALQMLEAASAAQHPYQLVLMDWQMPGMDGLEVAEHIRRHERLSTTPAMLMVTAYCRDEVMERVTQLELQGLLIKPVTESTLFNAMHDALQQQQTKNGGSNTPLHKEQHLHMPAALMGRRILVVDDNALNREVAQDILELAGVQVTTASSGPDALNQLAQRPFDMVLLDVQMPEMDGLEVARQIRLQAQFQQLPVWALTAQARPEDRQAILASGMQGHITKPIDAQRLYNTLLQAMAHLPPSSPILATTPHSLSRTILVSRATLQGNQILSNACCVPSYATLPKLPNKSASCTHSKIGTHWPCW